jgi:hypothetical protein
MLNGLTVSPVRMSVPLSAVTAPLVPYAIPELPAASANSIRLAMPVEPNVATPVMPLRQPEALRAPAISNATVPVLPLASQPRPISLGLPGEFTTVPAVAATPERIAASPEAPWRHRQPCSTRRNPFSRL